MSDRINVIRAPRDSEHAYLAISRALTQDRRLSFEARGVLAYLLSKPSDWIVRVPDLQKEGNCGRDRIYRILKELREAGYLHRDQEHQANGTFTWGPYRVYEEPFTENTDMAAPHQEATQPFTEKPYTDKPYTENTDMVKRAIPHQKATQPYPALPYTENTDTYIIESPTDQRILQTTPPTPTPAKIEQIDVGGDEIVSLLDEYNIGAADSISWLYRTKYPDIDAATVRQSIENLLADGVPKGTIVKRLQNRPPEPGKPYQRSKAAARASPTVLAPPPDRPSKPVLSAEARRALLEQHRNGS